MAESEEKVCGKDGWEATGTPNTQMYADENIGEGDCIGTHTESYDYSTQWAID